MPSRRTTRHPSPPPSPPSPSIVTDADLLAVQHSIEQLRHASAQALATLSAGEAADAVAAAALSQEQLAAQVARLRGQYRRAVLSMRGTKQATADAKAEIDRLHLRLQNLFYEQGHLRGEIEACESYDHKYTSLPLIPVERFLELHPDLADADEHALMIKRIEHEHTERQKLENERQGLLRRKQGLIAENKQRKEDLANLDKDLEKFIDAAGPIIKTFEKEY